MDKDLEQIKTGLANLGDVSFDEKKRNILVENWINFLKNILVK